MPTPGEAAAKSGSCSAEVTLAERIQNVPSAGPGLEALPNREKRVCKAKRWRCQWGRRLEPPR